jgi:hypothetical protein
MNTGKHLRLSLKPESIHRTRIFSLIMISLFTTSIEQNLPSVQSALIRFAASLQLSRLCPQLQQPLNLLFDPEHGADMSH